MLECEGRPIMSQGEVHELLGEMVDDGRPNSGTLQAWYVGGALNSGADAIPIIPRADPL